jgi:hypothetical protein
MVSQDDFEVSLDGKPTSRHLLALILEMKAIKASHTFAFRTHTQPWPEQLLRDVRTDEPKRSCDQYLHEKQPPE